MIYNFVFYTKGLSQNSFSINYVNIIASLDLQVKLQQVQLQSLNMAIASIIIT